MDSRLYWAATTGHIDEMMDFGNQIDQVSEGNQTVLHLSAMYNKSISVGAILQKFPDLLNRTNSKDETALHVAANKGYYYVLEVLILECRRLLPTDYLTFIRKANKDLDTALHLAVRNNHLQVVKLLVEADPGDRHSQNREFETPAYLAAKGGYKEILEVIFETCRFENSDGPEGQTALHASIIKGNPDCAKVILQKRGDLVHKADNKGWTAMHYAAFHNRVSLIQILQSKEKTKFDSNHLDYRHGYMDKPRKKTALHIAAHTGNISVVLELIRLYTSDQLAVVDEEGQNILHIAADQNHKDVVECIMRDCEDIKKLLNTRDNNGNTPLHLLVMRGSFVPELIKHKQIERDAINNEKFTALDLLYHDEDIILDQLQIKEAFEDVKDNQGWRFWRRDNKSKPVQSPVPHTKRTRKDIKFRRAKAEKMKKEVQLYRERTNTQIIVTALITTVTFTVGFTMPGGYHQSGEVDEGLVVLSKKTAFDIFMVTDAVALLLSTSSLFLYFISSLYQDPHQVSKLIAVSTGLNIVSVVAMMLTFITGTYAVLPHSSALAIAVLVISCLFFPCVIYLLTKFTYDRYVTEKFIV